MRKLLRHLNLSITRYESSTPGRRAHLLSELGITTVVDVGANEGQYAAVLRENGYGGRIVSIEPVASAFARLRAAAESDPSWECLRFAAGAETGQMQINVTANTQSSSLLDPLEILTEMAPTSSQVGTETVEVRRLDALLDPASVVDERIWLKADVQGYEAKVLEGAGGILDRVSAIEIEMSLVPTYSDQARMCDDVAALARAGYTLRWIERDYRDVRTGHVMEVNGIFLRD